MGLRTKTPYRKGLAAWTLWSSDAYRRATTQRVKSLLFDIIKNFIYARDKIWDQDKRITRNEAAFSPTRSTSVDLGVLKEANNLLLESK